MADPDVSEVIGKISDEVAHRRSEANYPLGLEQQLEAEFASIVKMTHRDQLGHRDQILQQLAVVQTSVKEINGQISSKSRIPGVGLVHKCVNVLTRRQTAGLASQVRHANRQISILLELLSRDVAGSADADMRMVQTLSRHVVDRIAVVDHLVQVVGDLEDRLRSIENNAQ